MPALEPAVIGLAQQYCPQSPSNATIVSPITGNTIQNPAYTGHSGALRDSAIVEEPTNINGLVTVVVGFNTHYAAAVHEVLDAHHMAPTQAKYLERAMKEMQPKFYDYVKAQIQKEFA